MLRGRRKSIKTSIYTMRETDTSPNILNILPNRDSAWSVLVIFFKPSLAFVK